MKRGQWGIVQWGALATIVAALIAIIVYSAELVSFLMGVLSFIFPPVQPTPPENPAVISTTIVQPIQFNFSKVSMNFINPKKEIYSNSNNVICYSFSNPTTKINASFTLIGEWFLDDNKTPNFEYKENLSYEEIFSSYRANWYEVGKASKIRFRVGLSINKTPLLSEVAYNLTNGDQLADYLKNEDADNVTWNNDMLRDLIKERNLCPLSEEEQAKAVFSFVREKMNPPLETIQKISYDTKEVGAIKSWNDKVGTSSEYSFVYAALSRSIGIPAKIETNNFEDYPYYYVKVYLAGKGWIPVDVFNKDKKFGDCFVLTSNLKKGVKYKDICVPNLINYAIFEDLSVNNLASNFVKVDYTLKNVYNKTIKSYCIKANLSFYDETLLPVASEDWYLLNLDDLEENSTLSEALIVGRFDFDSMKLDSYEFNTLCK